MALAPKADFVCFRCEENEPGSGGPFLNLPLPKPACPNCRARRWMQRQWSGYSVTVGVRSHGEAVRMTREDVHRIDGIVQPMLEKRDAEKRRFPVGLTGYEVKAVGMGNVGTEVGKLAGTVGGEQAAAMTAASVQQRFARASGRSDLARGEVRAASAEETMVVPPNRQMRVAAKWDAPSKNESAAAHDALKPVFADIARETKEIMETSRT